MATKTPDKPSTSLAAQTGGLTLPGSLAMTAPPIMSSLQYAPYVTFAHNTRKDEWAKLGAKFGPSLKEGNMYYVDGDDLRALPSFKCCWITGQQHWVQKAPNGDLIAFSRQPKPEPFREHVEAVLLLFLEDKVTPVNVTFRTTKCGAAKTMDEQARLAATDAWGQLGPDHLATMQLQQPFLRMCADVTLGAARTSKKSGLPYAPLYAKCRPTTSTEWIALKAFVADPDTQADLDAAGKRFKQVFNDLAVKEVK